MRDGLGREINYLRISITDRCNLRCRYCMPAEGVADLPHSELLTYEEILRAARVMVKLGINRFKITGGEPLCRRDCTELVRELKQIHGTEQVTLTTNGLLIPQLLDELLDAGLDGVNISLDTLDANQFRRITRRQYTPEQVLETVKLCAERLPTKINAVMLEETADQLIPLARLACDLPVDVRFIEPMPIGTGTREVHRHNDVLCQLLREWPDLSPTGEHRGNGPAVYYGGAGFRGRIGLIEAVSHCFCGSCNRLRLTSTGWLKPCLYYEDGTDLRAVLRGGGSDALLQQTVEQAVRQKPERHHFITDPTPERHMMNQIGG